MKNSWYGLLSGSGNEITQGPLWIRPEALLKDAFYETQIVGHTELCLNDFLVFKEKDVSLNRTNTVIIADSNNHTVFSYINTENLPDKKRGWKPQHI